MQTYGAVVIRDVRDMAQVHPIQKENDLKGIMLKCF